MNGWKTYHAETKTGQTKVWQIRQEGAEYRILHGQLGGKMQEATGRPGPKGRQGTASYLTAEENCEFNVTRLTRHKLEKGYRLVDDSGVDAVVGPPRTGAAKSIDFSKPLPKSFSAYKPNPERVLTDEEHERIFKSGTARYTRKRDGECHLLVHHDDGWHVYSRRMDDVTDKFPMHVGRLTVSMLPVGTLLLGEMVTMRRDGMDDPIAFAKFSRSLPQRARDLVRTGAMKEPSCLIYDVLFFGGKDLSDTKYDDRQALLRDTLLFGSDIIQPVEAVIAANPRDWLPLVKRMNWEGLVLVDTSVTPGSKFWSLDGSPGRPVGHYKLKPVASEDAVVFAAVKGNGKRRDTVGSLMLMQKRPTDGTWFFCGKAGSGLTSDGGELDCDVLRERCKKLGVPLLDDDNEKFLSELMHSGKGFVVELSFQTRQPGSNKFKFPVIKRVREDKGRDECVATNYSR